MRHDSEKGRSFLIALNEDRQDLRDFFIGGDNSGDERPEGRAPIMGAEAIFTQVRTTMVEQLHQQRFEPGLCPSSAPKTS